VGNVMLRGEARPTAAATTKSVIKRELHELLNRQYLADRIGLY